MFQTMLLYLIIWFLAVVTICFFVIYAGTWVYTEKSFSEVKVDRGALLVAMVAFWLIILAPFVVEQNSLTIMKNIIEPNMMTAVSCILLLFLTGMMVALAVQAKHEDNDFLETIYWVLSLSALGTYFVVLLILIPMNIEPCPCVDGYFGANCDKTCILDSTICSGHGSCGVTGCICDDRFVGEFCERCVNNFNYATNCSACSRGYSLDLDCTTCEKGRDPSTDCQSCLDGYLDDETYNNPVDGCTVCKENYFRPTSNPLVGSYNKFLEFGDVCTACEGYPNVCNGHGTCNHFLLPNDAGNFDYNGTTTLGQLANGECECDVGYAGPNCTIAPGFDGDNEESICNAHGTIVEVFDQEENDIFETFQYIECECDEGYTSRDSRASDACACKGSTYGNCDACVFGYFLSDGKCVACAGGGFLKACNADIGAGVCQTDGTCSCSDSYLTGGYKGDSCNECLNNNFYKQKSFEPDAEEPERCIPCPGATGPLPNDACGGNGFCITDTRLASWQSGAQGTDSYDAFLAMTPSTLTIEELANLIGTCVCHDNFALNGFGLCS